MKNQTDGSGNEGRRWQAVAERDGRADGSFVYAVRSTGVFCRPSCPSRRPRRERVVFFDSSRAAFLAGYRACRRCCPDREAGPDPWIEKVRRVCVYLAHAEDRVSLATLAARVGGSPYHLQRSFKRLVGVSPREYADACRLQHVKERLRAHAQVTRAVVDAGYGSSSRFYERAAPKLAMAPSTYRRGGGGVRIRYTIVDSVLGRLLVAATDRGVCAVSMGSTDGELERALATEFPAATLVADPMALATWTSAILDHLAGRRPHADLPLDVQATAFQWQVWTALAAIPCGETRSYRDVASAIGRPTAARAVARACATNPVALIVPCHRVVPAGGGLGGYRWGIERKKALLENEQRAGAAGGSASGRARTAAARAGAGLPRALRTI
jgi:AraC family transcriptional regulator of adaptative response/methylated-DNA-[protein]-cysteine methyltransferase